MQKIMNVFQNEEEDLQADYHTDERYDEDHDGTEHNVAG
jgi:hypothetical protein